MIPKKAIEKAIEGGWEGVEESFWSEGKGEVVKERRTEPHSWHQIALDPSFWQALGKALGWKQWVCGAYDYTEEPCRTQFDAIGLIKCPYCRHIGAYEPVHFFFERFVNVIYRGGDTQKFWDELLTV